VGRWVGKIAIFGLYMAYLRNGWKGPRLPLISNSKLHTASRFLPKSMTLYDSEQLLRTICRRLSVLPKLRRMNCRNAVKDPYHSGTNGNLILSGVYRVIMLMWGCMVKMANKHTLCAQLWCSGRPVELLVKHVGPSNQTAFSTRSAIADCTVRRVWNVNRASFLLGLYL